MGEGLRGAWAERRPRRAVWGKEEGNVPPPPPMLAWRGAGLCFKEPGGGGRAVAGKEREQRSSVDGGEVLGVELQDFLLGWIWQEERDVSSPASVT